jgi:hypothetical protein
MKATEKLRFFKPPGLQNDELTYVNIIKGDSS